MSDEEREYPLEDLRDPLAGAAILGERRVARQPERRLLLAVLREAMLDALGAGGMGRREGQEAALGWIDERAPRRELRWSFVAVCEFAGISPSWLRERLRRKLAAGVGGVSVIRIAKAGNELRAERAPSLTRRTAWTPERRAAASIAQKLRAARARDAVSA